MLQEFDQERREQFISLMEPKEHAEVSELLAYPEDTAGGLMTTKYASIPPGGTIQKVILARELASGSNLLVVSEPTWGLDVASSQFVYEKILAMRSEGAGVLFISSNLDEILGIADTIAVMYRGRVVTVFPNASHTSKEQVGEYMLGLKDDTGSRDWGSRKDASR